MFSLGSGVVPDVARPSMIPLKIRIARILPRKREDCIGSSDPFEPDEADGP
jgi:hypothetical protein